MAHSAQVNVVVNIDTRPARAKVRRLLALAKEANQELAKLDEDVILMERRLKEYGIQLVVEE